MGFNVASHSLAPVGGPQTLAEMHAAHLARQARWAALPTFVDFEATRGEARAKQLYSDVALAMRLLALSWKMRAATSAIARRRWAPLIWRAPAAQRPPIMPGEKIIGEVARKYGIPVVDLVGPSRRTEHVTPRQEAMWRLKRELKMSTPQIGRLIGNRDHTTVLYSIKAHAARMADH